MNKLTIRDYKPTDQRGWLHCRVLAFLETAYFDDVLQKKEQYESDTIELVAVSDNIVVGLIDIEIDDSEAEHSGMIRHIAVHPDHRGLGIAQSLLAEAIKRAKDLDLVRFEAWTRDDQFVNDWYLRQGFSLVQSYYHVYADGAEMENVSDSWASSDLYPVSAFFHYVGNDETFLAQFKRVHQCRRYDLRLAN